MLRRSFLKSAPLAAAAFAAPPAREVPVKLGFDTYSLRAFKWNGMQLLDFAAQQKLDTIQFSSLGDYGVLDAANLQKVKDRAAQLNISIDSGMGCICETSSAFNKKAGPAREQLLQGLRVAHQVGAKVMRCYLGWSDDRINTPIEKHMDTVIQLFRSVRSEAMDLNVKIALENHSGDMTARELRWLIEEAGKEYVAACLDTGNPLWCAEDPLLTVEVLGPYAVTTHVRDSIVFETPHGAAGQWVAMGDGIIDLAAIIAGFRRLCPQATMQLEIITGRPPRMVNYLDAEYWKMYPKMPAADLARFVALAKRGHPFLGTMVVEDAPGAHPAIMTEALREQQRIDLVRSFEYCRKTLNVGLNWRA